MCFYVLRPRVATLCRCCATIWDGSGGNLSATRATLCHARSRMALWRGGLGRGLSLWWSDVALGCGVFAFSAPAIAVRFSFVSQQLFFWCGLGFAHSAWSVQSGFQCLSRKSQKCSARGVSVASNAPFTSTSLCEHSGNALNRVNLFPRFFPNSEVAAQRPPDRDCGEQPTPRRNASASQHISTSAQPTINNWKPTTTANNNNNNTIWRGSFCNRRGASTPRWGVEACSHPSRRPNPIPAIPPYVVRTPHLHGAPTSEETVKL